MYLTFWEEENLYVADLAYTILATFDSLAYHLYNIKYKDNIYDNWVCVEDNPDYE